MLRCKCLCSFIAELQSNSQQQSKPELLPVATTASLPGFPQSLSWFSCAPGRTRVQLDGSVEVLHGCPEILTVHQHLCPLAWNLKP